MTSTVTMLRLASRSMALLLTTTGLAAASAPQGLSIPPPPREAPEFFNPTYTDHRSDSTCSAARLALTWRYAPEGLSVTGLVFNGQPASSAELAKINGFLKGFAGDAVARIECGNEGAVIYFVGRSVAGSPDATINFSWLNGRATLIGRSRFELATPARTRKEDRDQRQ